MSTKRTPGPEDTALWITRMARDGSDREVVTLYYRGNAARKTYEHAKRVIPQPEGEPDLSPGNLLVTLLVDGGMTSTDDAPLIVPKDQATWFLRTWLKVELDQIDGGTRRFFRTA